MYKKIAAFLVIALVSISISGCQKKSSVNISTATTTSTPIPSELQHLNDSASPQSSFSQGAAQNTDSFIVDSSTIDTNFEQNYALALEDAQKSLKNGVKYCGVKVSFYGATLTELSRQSFVFYSDEFSKDYYWIVSLNGYQNNQKTRSFAAKRDLANEIKCTPNTASSPSKFSGAYGEIIKTENFKKIDPGTIAETTLETMNTGWNVTVTNNAGENKLVTTINPSATGSSPNATQN